MIRILLATAALAVATPALACGGNKNCGDCAGHHETTASVDFSKVDAAAGTKLSLAIEGMKCGSCSDKITAALSKIDGVNAVVVSHETGEARVAFDAAKTNADALTKAVVDTGFTVKADPAQKQG